MSTSGVGATSSSTGTSSADSVTSSTQQLNENSFLDLLVTELQNQDPTNPVDDTQFISELAQFSSLQQMSTMNTNLSAFTSNASVMGAASLIGQTVTSIDPTSGDTISGTVTNVQFSSSGVTLTAGGQTIDLDAVTSVK
jgi:flagellar basal-body rod modification protein FlgD